MGKGFRVRVIDQKTQRICVETTKPQALAKLIDPKILTHILRGLLAADHIASLHQLATLNATHVKVDSVAQQRNFATLAGAVWGFLYEAGGALDKLNGMRIRARLTDVKAWDDLEVMRKRWSSGNQFSAQIRNNVSFHLGDERLYLDGLLAMAQTNRPMVLFEIDGDGPTDVRWHLPQNALFQGLGLTTTAISAFTEAASKESPRDTSYVRGHGRDRRKDRLDQAAARERARRLDVWCASFADRESMGVRPAAAPAVGVAGLLVVPWWFPSHPAGLTPGPHGVASVVSVSAKAAEEMRRAAFAQCEIGHWRECVQGLDWARDVDPAGEGQADAQWRRRVEQATLGDKRRTDMPIDEQGASRPTRAPPAVGGRASACRTRTGHHVSRFSKSARFSGQRGYGQPATDALDVASERCYTRLCCHAIHNPCWVPTRRS
jgi:hypothetical protein